MQSIQKLVQKRFGDYRSFELKDDEVHVIIKSPSLEKEFTVAYAKLGLETFREINKTPKAIAYLLFGFTVLYIGLIVSSLYGGDAKSLKMIPFWMGGLIMFAIFGYLALKRSKKKYVYITGGNIRLELIADKPSEKEVNMFVEAIQQKIKEYYKGKFMNFNKNATEDEIKATLTWLREIKVLSREEESVELSKNLAQKSVKITGFTKGDKEEGTEV